MKSVLKFTLILLFLHGFIVRAATTVTNIATGSQAYHSLFIESDGSLWAMGDNQWGELGDGTTNNSIVPEEIVASNVIAAAAGEYHSLFIKSDGSLWAMGWDGLGQLGDHGPDNFYNYTNRPKLIITNNVTAIAAGLDFSLFLKSDGSLWGMGSGYYENLGPMAISATSTPFQIVASNVTAIAAGYRHSLFVKSDGSLWAMGTDDYGELGDGTNTFNYYYKTNTSPEEIVSNNVTAVAAGAKFSLFLKSNGSLWGMGEDNIGQLGDNQNIITSSPKTNRPEQIVTGGVTAIAVGYDYSLFLKSDGSVWGMGDNYAGPLGNGAVETTPNVPVPSLLTNGVTAIACGNNQSLFIKSDGSLWAVGGDGFGQLGDGFSVNVPFPATGTPEQIFPRPQPVMDSDLATGSNVQINATCGFGGNYRLLSSTNIALALSQWTPISTYAVTNRGPDNFSVTLTNALNLYGQNFYILQSQ